MNFHLPGFSGFLVIATNLVSKYRFRLTAMLFDITPCTALCITLEYVLHKTLFS
jgi:hypothetical protein